MSTVALNVPKHRNPEVTEEQIRNAVALMREYFPEDDELASVSNDELFEKAHKFIHSDELFTVDFGQVDEDEAFAVDQSACNVAIAVVVIDCVFMVLGFCGLHAANQKRIARATAEGVAAMIEAEGPLWKSLIKALADAGPVTAKAKAIFAIVKAAFTHGIVKIILKQIKHQMHWWSWVITGVAAVAQIAVLVLTDGAAFIAEVALNVAGVAGTAADSVTAIKTCEG